MGLIEIKRALDVIYVNESVFNPNTNKVQLFKPREWRGILTQMRKENSLIPHTSPDILPPRFAGAYVTEAAELLLHCLFVFPVMPPNTIIQLR